MLKTYLSFLGGEGRGVLLGPASLRLAEAGSPTLPCGTCRPTPDHLAFPPLPRHLAQVSWPPGRGL